VAACSSETAVNHRKNTRRTNPENNNLNKRRLEKINATLLK
jgi:hypothetical protein